jgi:hypothetical protein
VGDVFQAGDYDVTVTNISAGSQGNGWTGTGLVNQNLIGQIQMPLTVAFQNIKVNECYQYFDRGINGAVVQTKVDPSFKNLISFNPLDTQNISITENQGKSLVDNYIKINDLLTVFTCSNTQRTDLTRLIAEQDALAIRAQQNTEYTAAQKAQILVDVNEVKGLLQTLLSCCAPAANARINAANCTPPESIVTVIKVKEVFLNNLPESSFAPYVIAQSLHRPTLNHAGTAVHQDMSTSPYTNGMFLNLGGAYLFDLGYSKETLLSDIKGYSDLSTTDKTMEGILRKMFDRFYTNTSINTVFEDEILTQKAVFDNSTTRFLNRISESLEFELKKNDTFVKDAKALRLVRLNYRGDYKYNTDLTDERDDPLFIYDDNGLTNVKRDDFPSPTYTNLAGGLKTAINDTWGYDIKIENFTLNKRDKTYKAEFEVTIFDHFGIDPTDAREYNHVPQIRKWFILQHKFQCTPFITTIKFKHTINGNY